MLLTLIFSFHQDPESVYPGGEHSSLTEQWTNQAYRAALRMPEIPIPTGTNTQGTVACYDVTEVCYSIDFFSLDRAALTTSTPYL